MRGRVHRRGKGWAFVVDVGIDPVTGKRRQRTKGGFPTRKAAEAAMREVLNSVDEGSYVSRSTLKVGEYLRQWLETMRAQVRESTWYGYRIAVDRLVEQLGEVRLQSLTPLQVETAYAKLRKDGGRYGGPLAPKTVRNCHIVLHRALVDAVRLDLVNRNVAGIARPPTVPRHESVTWTAEELEAFLEHVSDDRLFPAYIVLANTGMRRGKVFGLRWSDLDLDNGRLSVVQTLQCIDAKLVFSTTKTNRSRRTVSLDPVTVDVLRQLRKDQAEERLALGPAYDTSRNLVFAKQDGSPVHPDVFSRVFKKKVAEAGLPELRGPHNLRHTWATLALKAGVHPKVVSDRLGHATIAVTIDTYSHVAPSLDADAANTVAAAIFSKRNQEGRA
jgi:integrase